MKERHENMKITRTKDYNTIAKLNKHVQEVHVKLRPDLFMPFNLEAVTEKFKSVIDNEKFMFLLLEDNDEAIGFAWIEFKEHLGSAFKKASRSVYVHQISISETERSKGYGSALMEEIYDVAKKRGAGTVELDYWAENEGAQRFYQKEGFAQTRTFVAKELK